MRRQHLVARDQQLEIGAVEAGVLGRVAAADHHAPQVLSYAQFLAVVQAAVAVGQGVDVLAEVAEAGAVGLQRAVTPACAAVEGDGVGRRLAAAVRDHDAAVQIFQARHVQRHMELARQPAGQAHMVGVHVGDQHARQRAAVGGLGEQRAPGGHAFVGARTGVDDGPALAVIDGPEIDVIQRIGQGHAYPEHAGCDLQRLPALRWRLERVVEHRLGRRIRGVRGVRGLGFLVHGVPCSVAGVAGCSPAGSASPQRYACRCCLAVTGSSQAAPTVHGSINRGGRGRAAGSPAYRGISA